MDEVVYAIEEYGVEQLMKLANDTISAGIILSVNSVLITLPKKAGATECDLHRKVSLTSHVLKTVFCILLMRLRQQVAVAVLLE
jgi:hypothetical protein